MTAPAVIRVLVVDDHSLFRRGLIALLAGDTRFAVVGEADDASEAHRRAAQTWSDVILLDNHMPGVKGVDALAGFKEVAPQARVLMLTVSEDQRDLAAALRGGARGYLLKTMDSDMLASAVLRTMAGEAVVSPELASKLVSAFQALGTDPATPAPAGAADPIHSLLPREREILAHIARGASNKEVARAGHRRGHRQDPCPAHPAQAGPGLAGAGGGLRRRPGLNQRRQRSASSARTKRTGMA